MNRNKIVHREHQSKEDGATRNSFKNGFICAICVQVGSTTQENLNFFTLKATRPDRSKSAKSSRARTRWEVLYRARISCARRRSMPSQLGDSGGPAMRRLLAVRDRNKSFMGVALHLSDYWSSSESSIEISHKQES